MSDLNPFRRLMQRAEGRGICIGIEVGELFQPSGSGAWLRPLTNITAEAADPKARNGKTREQIVSGNLDAAAERLMARIL